ncbi:MAG: hypothetical protein AN484_16685 [Aphanizomenon flos-aquae WA102]|uniref:Uncharacterized protein n=1 Tax=Aphanizomenon flos-aquae WA102 TaxID=1710896 RepID=A0A1B7WZU5_APHFL|nr:MAG: hypothetical protein AN484_16685 [Aphanizomenon flos-aquae WA102]
MPFQFFDSTDLLVVASTAGVPTTLVNGTGYTVTGGSGSTGSIVTTAAVPATSQVIITRNTAKTQLTSYTTGDRFPALTHERALDKLTMLVQEATVSSLPPTATASGSAPYVLQASSAGATPAWVPQSAGGIAAGAITNTMLAGSITPDKLSTGAPTWNAGGTLTATSFNGNASTATSAARLTTPRAIGLSGDVTGTASFDGSANATIASTIANLPNGIVTASKLGSNEQKQIAKAWGKGASTGGLVPGSYGIDTITRTGLGAYTVQLPINYTDSAVAVVTPDINAGAFYANAFVTSSLPTTIQVRIYNSAPSAVDARFMLAVFAN